MAAALRIVVTRRFEESYRKAATEIQTACDRVIVAIATGATTPGQRNKPILPTKRYREARLNRGDRLIFRIDGRDLLLVDLVAHDDIARYGG